MATVDDETWINAGCPSEIRNDGAKCDSCNDPSPFDTWDEARAAGWISTTWAPDGDVTTFCPECWSNIDAVETEPW